MKSKVNAVLLAGGLGVRMGPMTKDKQKGMLEVDNKPIISHILDGLLSAFGSVRVILATGHQGEKVRKMYGKKYRNISIDYVHNPNHIGMRRRILLADGLLEGPFFVIGSDVLVNPTQYANMAQTFESYSTKDISGVVSGANDLEPAPTHALIYAYGNRIVEIQTYPPFDTLRPFVYRDTSLWYFDQRTLQLLKKAPSLELNISPVLNEAIKSGAGYLVERYYDRWYHFATPNDLHKHILFKRNHVRD